MEKYSREFQYIRERLQTMCETFVRTEYIIIYECIFVYMYMFLVCARKNKANTLLSRAQFHTLVVVHRIRYTYSRINELKFEIRTHTFFFCSHGTSCHNLTMLKIYNLVQHTHTHKYYTLKLNGNYQFWTFIVRDKNFFFWPAKMYLVLFLCFEVKTKEILFVQRHLILVLSLAVNKKFKNAGTTKYIIWAPNY